MSMTRAKPAKRFASFRKFLRAPGLNLARGAKIVFLVRVEPRAWDASPGQLVTLALVGLVCSVALTRTFVSGEIWFNWYELRASAFDFSLLLLTGWFAAQLRHRPADFLVISVALFASLPTLDLIITPLWHIQRQLSGMGALWSQFVIHSGAYLWLLLTAVVLVRRTTRLAYRQVAVAVIPVLVLGLFGEFLPSSSFWYDMPAETTAAAPTTKYDSPASEEMLNLQPRLAQEAIRTLHAQRPGVADLYFVGFAPYAAQDVFLKEGEVIRKLMDERFDTRGRSLLVVNNSQTLRKYPNATVTNLRAALTQVGRIMDRDEDVLVLYLTSHGSKEHRLSARYRPLQLEEIDPALLRRLLDEARIKWRVVVVSACYAGGFIEPLRTPTTLVMTAADATHTSFGCGAESEMTYFAKAVFDEQLRQTFSFEQAFQSAVPIIREREQTEKAEFSNPQIAVGDDIRRKLAEIERRLKAAPADKIK